MPGGLRSAMSDGNWSFSFHGLQHAIFQWHAGKVAMKVFEEMPDQALKFIVMATGNVRCDVAVCEAKQWMVWWQWFGVGDIEPGGGEMAGTQSIRERRLIHGRAATDVVEDGAGFHPRQPRLVQEMPRFRV